MCGDGQKKSCPAEVWVLNVKRSLLLILSVLKFFTFQLTICLQATELCFFRTSVYIANAFFFFFLRVRRGGGYRNGVLVHPLLVSPVQCVLMTLPASEA